MLDKEKEELLQSMIPKAVLKAQTEKSKHSIIKKAFGHDIIPLYGYPFKIGREARVGYVNGEINFLPGLNEGIHILLDSTEQDLTNKQICILANSDQFAEPLEKYFLNKKLKAQHTHLRDSDWMKKVKNADVLITAVGQALLITEDNIKDDTIIIDVGTNRLTKNTIVGDVDFDSVYNKCSYITPVPGGVGPMTIAMLLKNSVRLAK